MKFFLPFQIPQTTVPQTTVPNRLATCFSVLFLALVLQGFATAQDNSYKPDGYVKSLNTAMDQFEKELKNKNYNKSMDHLETFMGAFPKLPSVRIANALAEVLKAEDKEAQIRAAELLGSRQEPIQAVRRLAEHLKKSNKKHRGYAKTYIKNLNKIIDLLKVDTSKNFGENISKIVNDLNKYAEVQNKIVEKLNHFNVLGETLCLSLSEYRSERALKSLRDGFRLMNKTHEDFTLPFMRGLIRQGSYRGLNLCVKTLKTYDIKAIKDARRYHEDQVERGTRDDDFLDWGLEYHEALATFAEKRKLKDKAPKKWDPKKSPRQWAQWFKHNKQWFPHKFDN